MFDLRIYQPILKKKFCVDHYHSLIYSKEGKMCIESLPYVINYRFLLWLFFMKCFLIAMLQMGDKYQTNFFTNILHIMSITIIFLLV